MELRRKISMAAAMMICILLNITGCGGKQAALPQIPATVNSSAASSEEALSEATIPEEASTQQDVIELKFHHHDPGDSVAGQFFESWAKEVSDASQGTIKITVSPDAELGAAKDTYDMVINGTADMAWGIPSYFPGRFPLSEVFTLPMMGIDSAEEASQIFWDLYTKTDYLKSEYAPFKVLFLYCHADVPIAMKNTQMISIIDIKGQKIRVAGTYPTAFFKALGASPILIPANDIYISLERGVLDGVAADWHLLKSFNIPEQTQYYLDVKLYEGPLFCVMNQRVYDSLPPDAKKAIDEKSGQSAVTAVGKAWQSARQEVLDRVKANNGVVSELSPEMREEFQKVAESVWAKWIRTNEEKGLPAQEVFDYVREAAAK